MTPLVDRSGVLWFPNELAGYVRFRRSKWEPDRFKSILTPPSGFGKRASRRTFARGTDAIRYRHRVAERIALLKANRPKETGEGMQAA